MADESHKLRVKEMLIEQLRLRMQPAEIVDDAPLFGEGLGLDSVDAIELVTAIEESFGYAIQGEEEALKAFGSVDTLADYLVAQGALT